MISTDAVRAGVPARRRACTPRKRPRLAAAALVAAAVVLISPARSWADVETGHSEPATSVAATTSSSTATSGAPDTTIETSPVTSTSTPETSFAGETVDGPSTESSMTTQGSDPTTGRSVTTQSSDPTETTSPTETTEPTQTTSAGTSDTFSSGSSTATSQRESTSATTSSPGEEPTEDTDPTPTTDSQASNSTETSGNASAAVKAATATMAPLAAPSTGTTVTYASCVGNVRDFTVKTPGQQVNVSTTIDGGNSQSWTDYPVVTLTAATGQTVVFRDGFETVVGTFKMPTCAVDYVDQVGENGSYVFNQVPNATTSTPAPTHGTVIAQGDGTIRYTPTAGYNGPDSFGYSAPTGRGTVSITVVRLDGQETFTLSSGGCGDSGVIANHTSHQHTYTFDNNGVTTVVVTLAPGQQSTALSVHGSPGDYTALESDSGKELGFWVWNSADCDGFRAETFTISRDHVLTLFVDDLGVIRDPDHGTLEDDPAKLMFTYRPDPCYVGDDYFIYREDFHYTPATFYVTVHVTGTSCAITSTRPTITTAGSTPTSQASPRNSTAPLSTSSHTASTPAAIAPATYRPPAGTSLASTGVDLGPLLAGSDLLVLTGLALLRIGRRRTAQHH